MVELKLGDAGVQAQLSERAFQSCGRSLCSYRIEPLARLNDELTGTVLLPDASVGGDESSARTNLQPLAAHNAGLLLCDLPCTAIMLGRGGRVPRPKFNIAKST